MSNKTLPDLFAYFRDKNGKICYFEKCIKCKRSCKQSFRVLAIECKHYKKND